MFLLTLVLAKLRGKLPERGEQAALRNLRHLPVAVQSVLALEPQIMAWSEAFASKQNALFLGRGRHYPIALEGALKLKEITYIHAEAYPAGELKHGPLALVDASMPVVTIAPADDLLEKLKSNMQEVRARGGQLYVFADGDTRIENDEGIHVIRLPSTTARCRRCCTWWHCNCWRTTPPVRAAPMSTSHATWPNRSRWNKRRRHVSSSATW